MNLKVIQKLLDQRLFNQVIREVDKLKTESDIEKAKAFILRSEAMLALADFNSAYINEALDILRPTSDFESFAFAKYLKARFEIIDKNLLSAQENLNESYVYYKRIDNFRGMARTSNLISYVYYQQGDYQSFESNAKKSLENYYIIDALPQIAMVKQNMSTMFVRMGSFDKANKLLAEIKLEYKDHLLEDKLYNYYHVKSLYNIFTNNFKEAEKALHEASKLSKDLKRELFRQYEISALLYLHKEDYKKAEMWGIKGVDLALKLAKESTLVSQIKRILGEIYLATQRFELAEKISNEALDVAQKNNERIEIAACYRIFAQLEYQKGNNDKAKEWFKKSIDMFRLINSNYELAVTRYLAASTTLYVNGEKSSMLYLANEYFESENITHYIHKVQKELQKNNSRTAIKKLSQIDSQFKCPDVITVNEKMVKILDHTKNIASSGMSVLLTGETGTGKEIMARYIHYHSGRNDNFVAVNSSAFPNEMFEAELFGYKKGAFTGAKDDKPGLFEMAEGGTFFLDEIGDINLESQAKLLRVLDQKLYRRLGENKERKLNFRLIAATNRNLEQMIKDNLFRPDLYFRLKEFEIKLPPLRERKNDILALIEHFLQQFGFQTNGDAKLIEQLADKLSEQQWDGNIRELRNELKRLYLFADKSIEKMIELAEIKIPQSKSEQLLSLLKKTNWNQSEVARILNVSETAIRKRIKRYNLLKPNKIKSS